MNKLTGWTILVALGGCAGSGEQWGPTSDLSKGDGIPGTIGRDKAIDQRRDAALPVTGEICGNGFDDDGKGQIDENCLCTKGQQQKCYNGLLSTRGVGSCKDGFQLCVDDGGGREFSTHWGPCQGAVLPSAEVCDGVDNDCNGQLDDNIGCLCKAGDTRTCYPGPSATQNVGPCKAGTQTCNPDGLAWGTCVGAVLPSSEVCDNIDNNCNGVVDDGACVCQVGQTQPCYTGPANTRGVGACKDGAQSCKNDRTGWNPCTGDTLPSQEKCDGIDNDCNGIIDDSAVCVCIPGQTQACYTGPASTRHVGACKDGAQTCKNDGSGWNACLGDTLPACDVCGDSIDNDCDGKIDESCNLEFVITGKDSNALLMDCLWIQLNGGVLQKVGCNNDGTLSIGQTFSFTGTPGTCNKIVFWEEVQKTWCNNYNTAWYASDSPTASDTFKFTLIGQTATQRVFDVGVEDWPTSCSPPGDGDLNDIVVQATVPCMFYIAGSGYGCYCTNGC
jgi:hypothetical protein